MHKQKISILTFAKGDNYGAVLQAYALSKVLRKDGYEVEFVFFTWSNWKHRLLSHLTPVNYRFENFRNKYLSNFSKKCITSQDLTDSVLNTDFCIVGSDQVWNPDITQYRALHYFFDFVPEKIPIMSYAASFGVNEWKWDNLTDTVKSLLSRFKAISVREDSGIEICKNTFGIHAVKVLDPTLLLDSYNQLLLKPKRINYVLGFKFITSKDYYKFVKDVANELNVTGVIMDMFPRNILSTCGLHKRYFLSPQQWLTEIANASFIITDSFHTMVFSILFKRNFVIIPSTKLKKLQGRMQSLLKDLDLEDRIYSSLSDAYTSKIWEYQIDYSKVYDKLTNMRSESLSFLYATLQGKEI